MTQRQPDATELERLLARGVLTRRYFLAGMMALGATASGLEALLGSEPLEASAQVTAAQYVCIITLDAFRPDYRNLAAMPTLTALAKSGVSYDRAWVGQLESETPTGHASISTGSHPVHDGVIGFEWKDPNTGVERLDGWPKGVIAGDLEADLRNSGAYSIPLAIKAFDPTSKIVAISSEKVYAADAMGGWAADFILYHQRSGSKTNTLLTPTALPNHAPPADFFQVPHLTAHMPFHQFSQWDYLSAMLVNRAVEVYRPKLMMVNLPGGDVYGHPYGGPATPAVMRQVVVGIDRNLTRIVQAYKKAGIFDQTLFVISSDHGMVPNDRAVDGATTKAVVRAAGGDYLFHTGGTAAYIYLKNPVAAPRVATAMAKVPGVVAAYYKGGSDNEYFRAPNARIDSTLDAAYQYMFGTFSSPVAPDVIAPFRENTIGTKANKAHGDHGGANWGAQHIEMIFSGPGIRSNVVSHAPARLVDIAPTVLRALQLPAVNMDGAVLADALVAPVTADVVNQHRLTAQLTPHLNAFTGQSTQDIAQDVKAGAVPPPSAPARP